MWIKQRPTWERVTCIYPLANFVTAINICMTQGTLALQMPYTKHYVQHNTACSLFIQVKTVGAVYHVVVKAI